MVFCLQIHVQIWKLALLEGHVKVSVSIRYFTRMQFSFTAGIKHTPALVQSVSHYLLLGLCFHTLVSDPGVRPRSQTPVSDPGLRFWSQTPVSDPVSDPGLRFWSQSQPCPAWICLGTLNAMHCTYS